MTEPHPTQAERLAHFETRCFGSRSWSQAQLAGTLSHDGAVCGMTPAVGYSLGMVVADEVELYRIGVLPGARRLGHGGRLLAEFSSRAWFLGARKLFLEVREDNLAARALYALAKLRTLGRRPLYYRDGCAALMLGGPIANPSLAVP